uniref:Isocitrate dehydrogenase subunit gamma, mitochondrial n=2 Tax=Caligus rogercresseyi TaxID=217165 RepID=C1BPM3_CALRO|nr:Isocitrate dehydrogenase subunit gamma, mitochondrial precursor [Caligus rogercresseyi]|eukprot:TRINITY_DN204_c0_g1_i1.p1 TRINITY_DN204_c0_g1~~TRINITY_DN204_c0_g1_i1.p1  ORF type:complete len:374 (+),score=95.21 TRINITY_DN204_c0_g1_i1:44-1165(+)
MALLSNKVIGLLRPISGRCYLSGSSSGIPLAKYGGRHTVTLLPGDGIGPEMMGHVKQVFKHSGAPIYFEDVALDTNDGKQGMYNAISSIKRNGCGIKGNIETKTNEPDEKSRNVLMRNELDLFVNVLKCKSQPGIKTRHANIDICLVRQNTEGEYAMLEHENVPGVVESLKITTEKSVERLCRYAFEFAVREGRKKVTIVHKANIMKVTDGLFLSVGKRVAKDFPGIECNEMIIDNTCMQLVSNPWQFDVMVLTNLYGTIVTNLICGLIGGPGIVSGGNFGPKCAIFEPGTRNTGSQLVGRNMANPCAMINAGADLLEHLELREYAESIRGAVDKTLNEDRIFTADLGGDASSSEVVQNIIKYVKEDATKRGY